MSVHPEGDYFAIDNVVIKPSFVRGDVNGDGIVNISDVTTLLNLLMIDGEMPAAADFNGDGVKNISDVTSMITYLMSSSKS